MSRKSRRQEIRDFVALYNQEQSDKKNPRHGSLNPKKHKSMRRREINNFIRSIDLERMIRLSTKNDDQPS